MKPFAAAVVLVGPLVIAGQQQQAPNPRSGWPCAARLDASYFQIAEGSGGHLLLLAPEEIADAATLLTAFGSHAQTIFRLAGSLRPGVHELRVPIDPSVEGVLFSISVQCLQVAQVLRPSGVPAVGDDVTDLSSFRAERMVIVKRPEPGVWTIRVSGTGVSGVVAQARSATGLTQVQFAPAGSKTFTAVPSAGVENVVRIHVSGKPTDVKASLVSGEFRRLAELPLEAGESEGTYLSRFTPGAEGFRVLVNGTDAGGVAFQRIHAPLLRPMR
jgi:von Willebrand factor A domain-containing protein 7